MRVDVAFAPELAKPAPTAIVIDVLRATSTIAQALDAGYERVHCCIEVDDARALREELGSGVLAGERQCVRIPGFDLGNSPREFLEPAAEIAILTTTNGTRARGRGGAGRAGVSCKPREPWRSRGSGSRSRR